MLTLYGITSLCDLGNPGMATAGMGDVLTGMLASLIGQGIALREAVQAAVWVHSKTADLVVEDRASAALIASDIIEYLPITFHQQK